MQHNVLRWGTHLITCWDKYSDVTLGWAGLRATTKNTIESRTKGWEQAQFSTKKRYKRICWGMVHPRHPTTQAIHPKLPITPLTATQGIATSHGMF